MKSVKINAALNTIKQLCQILFPIITVPYVTRTLGAINYGKINFSNSIVSYFMLFASLGISSYAIREGALVRKNREKFQQFSSEIFSINIFSTLIAYLLLFVTLLVPQVARFKEIILIQSISIILTTLGADWVNSVYEDYAYITVRYLIFQIISICLLFIFVHTKNDYIKYAVILVTASAGGNILNIFYIRRYTKLKFILKFNWIKHMIPILVLFGNQLAITLYVNSDVTMLGFLSSQKMVGLYSLSSKIYTAFQQMLNAIIIVSVPRLSFYLGTKNNIEFKKLGDKIYQALLICIVPIVVGLAIYAKMIMRLAGGKEYASGGASLSILAFSLFFSLLAAFYTNCIMLPNKMENKILLITSIAAIINVLLNFGMIPMFGANGAALTTVISEIVVAFSSYKVSSGVFHKVTINKDTVSPFVGGIVIAITCILLKILFYNSYMALILSLIFSPIIYTLVLRFMKNSIVCSALLKWRNRIKK